VTFRAKLARTNFGWCVLGAGSAAELANSGSPLGGLSEPEVAAVLARIREHGGETFAEHRDSLTLRLESGSLEARSDRDIGAGVRFGTGGPRGYASTNLLSPQGLMDAARIAAASVGESIDSAAPRHGRSLPVGRSVPAVQEPSVPVDAVDIAEKASAVQRTANAAWAVDPRIRQVSVTYVDVVQHVLVVGREGDPMHDVRTRARITCRVVARDDGVQGSGFDGPGIGGGFELFEQHPPEQIGVAAAARALSQLAGIESRSGTTQVVLGPSAGGMLVHEACGHGLEADLMSRGSSCFSRTRGTTLAGPDVSIVDDPSKLAGFGSYGMDDEGRASQRTVLIDHGVHVAALTDADAATKLVVAASANGRRESYAFTPLCRMSNTYLDRGTETAAAIIGDVRRGVYLARLSGGEVDTATGDFTFTASEAYLIDHGQLAAPLRGVTLIGNSFRALEAIDSVGDDLAFTEAMCGKDGQWVPISYGSPTVRIAALTVTGSHG